MIIVKFLKKKKEEYLRNELRKLPIQIKIGDIDLTDVLKDFDATGLYPSVTWGEKPVYPNLETGYVFTPDMNG